MALMAGCGPSQPAASLLCQLLLKAASNDKRFVVEEAQRALSLISTKVLVLFLLCIQRVVQPSARSRAPAWLGVASDTPRPVRVHRRSAAHLLCGCADASCRVLGACAALH